MATTRSPQAAPRIDSGSDDGSGDAPALSQVVADVAVPEITATYPLIETAYVAADVLDAIDTPRPDGDWLRVEDASERKRWVGHGYEVVMESPRPTAGWSVHLQTADGRSYEVIRDGYQHRRGAQQRALAMMNHIAYGGDVEIAADGNTKNAE